AYACGLVNFMLIKVLAPGYYARQDTKTPVKFGVIAMISNMVFNAIFAYLFSYVGLAIATALSALINAGLLYQGLHRAGVYRLSRATALYIGRLVVAVAAMVAVLMTL
ncbi:lipid II flippase MurJ, partial [Streptococcus pyogenes]